MKEYWNKAERLRKRINRKYMKSVCCVREPKA